MVVGRRVERSIGGDLDKVLMSFINRRKKGMKNGKARKCYHQQPAINKRLTNESTKAQSEIRTARERKEGKVSGTV